MNKVNHLAIIMDGHRRWAKGNKKATIQGHREGAKKLFELCQWCKDIKIEHLTVYAFSTYNWKRTQKEINDLIMLMENIFQEQAENCLHEDIRIRIIGDISTFDKKSFKTMSDIQELTRHCTTLQLQLAIGYGGREDILSGIKKLYSEIERLNFDITQLNVDTFSVFLSTKDSPMVDLLIRPGGHKRLSNFLLWEIADSEIIFVDKYWPDFERKDFDDCINQYSNTEIKRGK